MTRNVLVLGAGGFIGGHLVNRLVADGDDVTGVDVKPRAEWHQVSDDVRVFDRLDASEVELLGIANSAYGPFDEVYNLAADMGGIGFIETHKSDCMLSVLTTTNVLRAAERFDWGRVFYSSSACVYPQRLQRDANVTALREEDAYPADPEDGYGWEKLFGERMHRHFAEECGVETRVARYHNIYGPFGTWRGGREKAPAALCRKVALAAQTGDREVEVWGDGLQTRSFTYVDDAIEGTLRVMRSSVREPLNVGSSELVTVRDLLALIARTANVTVTPRFIADMPLGVRGRNSDNQRIISVLDWAPEDSLQAGIGPTYDWIYEQVEEATERGEL